MVINLRRTTNHSAVKEDSKRGIFQSTFIQSSSSVAPLVNTGEKRSQKGGRPVNLYRMKEVAGGYTFVRKLED